MKRIFYSIALTCVAGLFATQPAGGYRPMPKEKRNQPAVFHQGDDILPSGATAGYNAPAAILLKSDKGFMPDLFFDVSFLYYYARLEGLNLANSAGITQSGTSYLLSLVNNGEMLEQEFTYKPAFAVAIGGTADEWTFTGQYTWIRQKTTTNNSAPSATPSTNGGAWIINNWFEQSTTAGQPLGVSSLDSSWKLAMDIADLQAARPFYQSRRGVISPFASLRAAWIRNALVIHATPSALLNSRALPTITSTNYSNSWSLGPRAGLGFHGLLGQGVRVEGNVAAAALFTAFTSVKHRENGVTAATVPSTIHASQGSYSTVRPELDMGLGLGWGMYLADEQYHIDFSADYDFLVFWGQNLIRRLMDQVVTGTGGPAGDLYLHGLNFTAKFDF